MRIPEVQEEMRQISARLREVGSRRELQGIADRLYALSNELSRRVADRGPRVSRRMSPAIAEEIRALRRDYPSMTQIEIAKRVNVSGGRVSEVLRGKRE